jgi:hypothetical protein
MLAFFHQGVQHSTIHRRFLGEVLLGQAVEGDSIRWLDGLNERTLFSWDTARKSWQAHCGVMFAARDCDADEFQNGPCACLGDLLKEDPSTPSHIVRHIYMLHPSTHPLLVACWHTESRCWIPVVVSSNKFCDMPTSSTSTQTAE